MWASNRRGFERALSMRRLEGLIQGAVEPDMEKKGLVRGFLRRDPALTQKLVILLRKNDTKTYHHLFPLGGSVSAVSSFQLRPVLGPVSSRVPSGDAMSRFVGFGDNSWDSFKNSLQTQGVEFSFLSHGTLRMVFANSIAPKTPVLKLNRPLACKPPAAIASGSTQVVCKRFAKPQVAGLRRRRAK